MADNRFALDRRLLLALPTTMLAGALADLAIAQPSAAGLVTDLSGEASAERQQARRMLAPQGDVFIGDRVATGAGARAGIRLGRATDLRLGEETRVTIDRFLVETGGLITLQRGAVLVDRFAPGSGPMRVRSAYGLIATRGTRFFAGMSEGGLGVFVSRGEVAVAAAGQQVFVKAGEGTEIARPGRPPTAPRIWSQVRIDAALRRIS